MAARMPAVRRLAAIVVADVVGYSRHMERDDAGTLTRLRDIRERVVDPSLARHAGHVVKTAGDGMLVEFGSADSALRFAVDLQREMAAANAAIEADERIEYRIGINLGDIIVDGADIVGDGVNVASRLEALAPPGGICVSSAVREQVHGALDVRFDDIGEQQVKNIMRPIRVYQVGLGGAAAGASPKSQRRVTTTFRYAIAAGAALAVVAGVALWSLKPWDSLRGSSSQSAPALSVAVRPFTVAAGDAADAALAESLGDDLARGLAALRWTKVVAPTEVKQAPQLESRALAARLAVRYFIDGDVRRASSGAQATARLVDAASGSQLWSDRFEFAQEGGRPSDARALGQLVNRVRIALFRAEGARAAQERSSATPMDLVLRGFAVGSARWTPKIAADERALYEEALRRDPRFVPALVALAVSMDLEIEEDARADQAKLAKRIDELTSQAIRIDPQDALAWLARSDALQVAGRWDEALTATRNARALEPTRPGYVMQEGWIALRTGEPAQALALFEQGLAMDPKFDAFPLHMICKAQLFLGRYDEAVAVCEKAAADNDRWLNQIYLCAAYAQSGDLAKAARAKGALLAEKPGYTIADYRMIYASSPPAFFDLVDKHLAPGLRKAGLPDR